MVLYVRLRTFLASNLRNGSYLQRIRVYIHMFSEILWFPKIYGCMHVFRSQSRLLCRNVIKTCAIERIDSYLVRKKNWMKNNIFSRRNLDFRIVNLELFSVILELPWFYRARLHIGMAPNRTSSNVVLIAFAPNKGYMTLYLNN